MTKRSEAIDIFLGVLLLIGIHIVAIHVLSFIGAMIALIPTTLTNSIGGALMLSSLLAIGLTQLLYVVPIIVILNRRRKYGLMKGVIIGAVLTALLNGGCWLMLFSAFSR